MPNWVARRRERWLRGLSPEDFEKFYGELPGKRWSVYYDVSSTAVGRLLREAFGPVERPGSDLPGLTLNIESRANTFPISSFTYERQYALRFHIRRLAWSFPAL